MLKKVQFQDFNAPHTYAPPTRDAVINTDDVSRVTPCESRGSGPWMMIRFRDGTHLIAQGKPEDLLKEA